MIHDGESEQSLRDYALKSDLISLRQDGMRWVVTGDTTLEEVLRVARDVRI